MPRKARRKVGFFVADRSRSGGARRCGTRRRILERLVLISGEHRVVSIGD